MLVTAAEVQTYLGRSFSDDEINACSAIFIPQAQAEIEGLINRPAASATFTESHKVDHGQDRVYFEHSPVHSIDSVTVNDVAVTDVDSYIVRSWGVEFVTLVGLTLPLDVEITYTAGLTGDEDGYDTLKSICMKRVARDMNKRKDDAHGVETLGVEGTSVNYESDGFLEHEIEQLGRFRRRVIR